MAAIIDGVGRGGGIGDGGVVVVVVVVVVVLVKVVSVMVVAMLVVLVMVMAVVVVSSVCFLPPMCRGLVHIPARVPLPSLDASIHPPVPEKSCFLC